MVIASRAARGVARPIYHATSLDGGPPWGRACEGYGDDTMIGPDGREWCISCLRKVVG